MLALEVFVEPVTEDCAVGAVVCIDAFACLHTGAGDRAIQFGVFVSAEEMLVEAATGDFVRFEEICVFDSAVDCCQEGVASRLVIHSIFDCVSHV